MVESQEEVPLNLSSQLFLGLSAVIFGLLAALCIRLAFQRVRLQSARTVFVALLLTACTLHGAFQISLVRSLRFEAGRQSCQAHLQEIQKALQEFRSQRRVLPTQLQEIVDYTSARQTIMTCPVTGADYIYQPPPGRRAFPNRPVCCDSVPHHHRSPWKTQKGRNVLYTGGAVLWSRGIEVPADLRRDTR